MSDKYCSCHSKHSVRLDHLEIQEKESRMDRIEIWKSIKTKISSVWLFALIPVLMAWIGFQVVIYDSVKNVETKIAVLQQQLKMTAGRNGSSVIGMEDD